MADPGSLPPEYLNGNENIAPNGEVLEIFGDDSSKVKTFAFSLDGVVTDVAYCDYSDKQFLIITQFQKIGTLISVTKGYARGLNGFSDVYEVKTICGLDNPDYHLATRYIAQQLNITKPVLFGICLKDMSLKTLKGIVKELKENLGF